MDDSSRRPRARATKRLRLTAAQREQILGDYRASGLTQERFAARHRINVATLRNWLYKPALSEALPGGLVPVQLVGPRPASARSAVTMRWPQGVELELAVDLDGDGVVRLLRDLLGPCSR
jgi:hypothetical protein